MLIKFKNWIIFTVLGVGVAMAAGQVLPDKIPDIVLEKTSIVEQLQNKTAKEKAEIKSKELAKIKIGKFKKDDLDVEIIGDIKVIEINGSHGIEFFAKAWKNNKQLGFSKDGSVEIERFRIFNPPVLVDDENGDIIREWIDEITKEVKQRKLKENPEEAIKQSLAHTIGLVGIENAKIIKGKIGNTTSTFYPSMDGWINRNNVDETWATIHDTANAIDVETAPTESTVNLALTGASATTNQWKRMWRSVFLFNTSALPDTDVISSATFSIYIAGKADQLGGSHEIALIDTNPASDDILVVGDFTDGVESGNTQQAPNLTIASISTSAYNNWTLNSTGEGNINSSGITKFGLKTEIDRTDTAPSWVSNENVQIYGRYSGYEGTTSDPKLVVVHSEEAEEAPKKQDILWFD